MCKIVGYKYWRFHPELNSYQLYKELIFTLTSRNQIKMCCGGSRRRHQPQVIVLPQQGQFLPQAQQQPIILYAQSQSQYLRSYY